MNPEDIETWKRALLDFRRRKDLFFESDHDSPLGHEPFSGLKYFDPDPDFRLETRLHRETVQGSTVMTTSKGTRRLFNNVGYFELPIQGKTIRLYAYQSAKREDPTIFVPFRDATSGKETYGAARYLDLEVELDENYAVDFNYAYYPYCAYSEAYVCPLPPRENWLAVAIHAGEKKYHD